MDSQSWFTSLTNSLQRLAGFLPDLLAAAALLFLGWLVARLLRSWVRRLLDRGLEDLGRRPLLARALEGAGLRVNMPAIVGTFTFWVVFLFFSAAAIETLGLPVVTSVLSQVASYLPNVLATIIIVFIGVIIGDIVRSRVATASAAAGVAYGEVVGRTLQAAIVLVAIVVGAEQIGLTGRILGSIVAVIIGSVLAGAGLAFGLGARTAVSNIIASYYVAQTYRIGQRIRIGGAEGRILQTTPTAVILETPDGQVLIPAQQFGEIQSVLIPEGR